ncbi:MAG: hypothetical protein AB2L14_10600 [Candidatus Xenobiia bacterium LiM19]
MEPNAESVITWQEVEEKIRYFRFVEYSTSLAAHNVFNKLYDLDTLAEGDFTWKILKVSLYRDIKPTVAMTKIQHVKMPDFFLRNETFWDLNIIGTDPDVDFKDFPSFSKRFFLTGPDHEAIREYFTPAILSRFEQVEKIAGVAQAHCNFFAYYWVNRTIDPEDFPYLAKEAATVLHLCLPD